MTEVPVSRSYHKVIALALVGLNLAAVVYAILNADPGQRHHHFREGSLVSWLFAAQMMGAALLFAACFFAGNIIPMQNVRRRDTYGWLVFAAGFLLLALDQQFILREQLTLAVVGTGQEVPPTIHWLVKVAAVLVAVVLVVFFRAIVLNNFRMVLAFAAGFWFLLLMLIIGMLFESVGVPEQVAVIMEGTAKLLAMAMFLTAPFVALEDRLQEARSVAHLAERQLRLSTSLRDLPAVHHAQRPDAQPPDAQPPDKQRPDEGQEAPGGGFGEQAPAASSDREAESAGSAGDQAADAAATQDEPVPADPGAAPPELEKEGPSTSTNEDKPSK